MKIFLSALEASPEFFYIDRYIDKYKNNLVSYYYLQDEVAARIISKSDKIVVDSGAHSFQLGKKVDWEEHTKAYANWISQFDSEKMLGYFEMDIDPAGIPYEYVLKLRRLLTKRSDKIIPVWHKNRGIEEFKHMCNNPINKDAIVAITGYRNYDLRDEDYIKFFSYAHNRGCKVFCLGMTREKILKTVPFDYVDSSSWKQAAIFGRVGKNKVSKTFSKKARAEVMLQSYLQGMELQDKYEKYWQKWREKRR